MKTINTILLLSSLSFALAAPIQPTPCTTDIAPTIIVDPMDHFTYATESPIPQYDRTNFMSSDEMYSPNYDAVPTTPPHPIHQFEQHNAQPSPYSVPGALFREEEPYNYRRPSNRDPRFRDEESYNYRRPIDPHFDHNMREEHDEYPAEKYTAPVSTPVYNSPQSGYVATPPKKYVVKEPVYDHEVASNPEYGSKHIVPTAVPIETPIYDSVSVPTETPIYDSVPVPTETPTPTHLPVYDSLPTVKPSAPDCESEVTEAPITLKPVLETHTNPNVFESSYFKSNTVSVTMIIICISSIIIL